MPRYIRSFVPGATYFFTVTLADRHSDLLVREVQRLRDAYAAVSRRHPFETLAICILPEHLHAIWRMPPEDSNFSMRWGEIKKRFSAGLPRPAGRTASQQSRQESGIWQRRFWEHQVRDEHDFARHVDYVHFNPVKHGWCRQVRDWPYSSFHRWVARGELPTQWGLVQGPEGGGFGERREIPGAEASFRTLRGALPGGEREEISLPTPIPGSSA